MTRTAPPPDHGKVREREREEVQSRAGALLVPVGRGTTT